MNEQTRRYLKGRFNDYYRRTDFEKPPEAHQREWGFVPWDRPNSFNRHNKLPENIEPSIFLSDAEPQHVYFNAGKFKNPSAKTMDEKELQSCDLVFDIDADHLDQINEEEATRKEMLDAAKDELQELVTMLEDDFGFDDLTIVFSGNRGYHVHVRDPEVQNLDGDAREQIIGYITGSEVSREALFPNDVANLTFEHFSGGWARKIHDYFITKLETIAQMDDEDALQTLQQYERVGEKTSKKILSRIRNNKGKYDGLYITGPEMSLFRQIAEEAVNTHRSQIDEPVTNDTHRLIRFPDSLHGGSGLKVTRIDSDDVEDFEPLNDSIPEVFRNHEIKVEVTESCEVELDGEKYDFEEGVVVVPEFVGVFLMCSGRAEKVSE